MQATQKKLLLFYCYLVFAAIIHYPSNSIAQSENPLGSIIGGFLGAISQQTAKSEWEKLSPDKLQCMQIGLKTKQLSVDALIKKGIMPADNRLQPFHKVCDDVLNKKLRTNFDCALKLKSGGTVHTKCDENFQTIVDGQKRDLERLQAAELLFNGAQVGVGQTITPEGRAAYRKSQQDKLAAAEAEKKASERKMQEEKAEQKRLAEEAERKRQEKLTQDTQRVLADRGKCKPKLEAVGFIKGKFNSGDVVNALGSAASNSNDAYNQAIPYLLAGAGKYPKVEDALSLRILNDAKSWQDAVEKHSANTVADADAAIARLRENCFYELSDYLTVRISLSANKEAEFTLGKSTSSTGLDLTIINLFKTVPAQSLEQAFNTKVIAAPPRFIAATQAKLAAKEGKERAERERQKAEADAKLAEQKAKEQAEKERLARATYESVKSGLWGSFFNGGDTCVKNMGWKFSDTGYRLSANGQIDQNPNFNGKVTLLTENKWKIVRIIPPNPQALIYTMCRGRLNPSQVPDTIFESVFTLVGNTIIRQDEVEVGPDLDALMRCEVLPKRKTSTGEFHLCK